VRLTEAKIQYDLYLHLRSRMHMLLPNYTPAGWYEADAWHFQKNGYCTEYEVKVSRADFKNDAKKQQRYRWGDCRGAPKHARLQLGDEAGPNRFWYVTPPGLIKPDELPEFAGLLEASPEPFRHKLNRIKEAPFLHRAKREVPWREIRISLTHRYWQLRGLKALNGAITTTPDLCEITTLPRRAREEALTRIVLAQAATIRDLESREPAHDPTCQSPAWDGVDGHA
jgi:hypothetical protein